MINENINQNRRRFIKWGVASAAVFSAFRFLLPSEKKKTPKTEIVKMLTREGKLVEVEIAALLPKKKKITNKELQNWILRRHT
jgi:hypothetical protein